MTEEILIQIQNATVHRGGSQLFENLNFKWKKNQHWAIVGKNGKELTDFLETIRGNTLLSRGSIDYPFYHLDHLEKTSTLEYHSFRDLIAYVSQDYRLKNKSNQQNFYFQQRFNSSESEETLSVQDYLSQALTSPDGKWNLENSAQILNLSHLLDQSLIKLSNGETRRLVLALGLMRQPLIYLMDQPMTGLDAKTRAEFGKILQSMIREGIHILITASPDEIPSGITHVAQLDSSGVTATWNADSFPSEAILAEPLRWDWNLLEKLLPYYPKSNETLIHLEKVTIQYGQKRILNEFSWKVDSGEKWLLKGPNGAGKSTLLSLLIGENPQAYSQDITLFGRKRGTGESIWDVKRPTGFVAPELARYFPANQTCRKVILSGLFDTMGLFKKTTPDQEGLANDWLTLFDLHAVKDIPIQRLSLANQRWTLLARALIKRPKLLILDEASQGMDEYQRQLFKDTVQQICERSAITLIYVSHYSADVPEAVNRVMELG